MKRLFIIITLATVFSCSIKKKDNAIDKQKIETISRSNTDSVVQRNDSRNTPVRLPIITKYDPKKIIDSTSRNLTQIIEEIPTSGTYIYDISYAEWQGRSMGEKVKVVIKGNTIKIIAIGKSSVGANDGEIIDEGMLVKHNVTGDWLITNDPSDADLDAYGGCVGAPMVIDFTNRVYITC